MSKRSYRYGGYYIEVAVQQVGVKHFEGTAAIFGSPESARSGQGPVHRCARMGRTRQEADRAARASAESWPRVPGRGLDGDGARATGAWAGADAVYAMQRAACEVLRKAEGR